MTLKKSIRGSQFKRFCVTCNREHCAVEWYPMYTYGIKRPTSYNCPRYLNPTYKSPRGRPRTKPEFIPESMKEDRRANEKSMIQPWREGEASAEYIKAYPEQSQKMFSERERMTAKNTWGDILHTNWEKTQ